MDSLWEKADTVMGYNIGRMEDMKDTGKMIRHVVKENFSILKVILIRVNGFMTSCMDKELIFLMMVQNTKVNGQIILRMAMAKKLLLIYQFILVNSLMGKRMEKDIKYLQIKLNI